MSFRRHALPALVMLPLALGVARADTLQPLSRHDDVQDPVLGQADLLAKLNRGRVYRVAPGTPVPPSIAADDLLVTEDLALDGVRPGDAIVVRISGNPAPPADEPVGLRRVLRVQPCASGCRELVATVSSSEGEQVLRLRPAELVGRLLYAFDRQGNVRELRDRKIARPTAFDEEYNGWRPAWSAEEIARRLTELQRPPPQRPPLIAF